jgi:hypothetical protein
MIQIVKEMAIDELQSIVYEHINKLLMLKNQHSDEKWKETHTEFFIAHIKTYFPEMSKFQIDEFFYKFAKEEIKVETKYKGVSAIFLNKAVEMYFSALEVQKNKLNKERIDISRSQDNIEKVKKSLELNRNDPKALYSRSEYEALFPESKLVWENLKKGLVKMGEKKV